jgi:glucose-1-phosphate cytidylyltransferase
MKTVILCGGMGSRLQIPSAPDLPKPLAPIGGRAMLHRLMDRYSSLGFSNFILLLGHKANEIQDAPGYNPNWNVIFRYTGAGDKVATGGRLKRVADLLGSEPFFLSYCDIIADVDISELVYLHNTCESEVTLTVTHPKVDFGVINMVDYSPVDFHEKPVLDNIWANVGTYIVNPSILRDAVDSTSFEVDIIPKLVREGKTSGLHHCGMWIPINTYNEWHEANNLWKLGKLKWLENGENE